MKYIIVIMFLFFLSSCDDESELRNRLFVIEVNYQNGRTDTLRVLGSDDTKFRLCAPHGVATLRSDPGNVDICYYLTNFRILNEPIKK